MTKPAEMSPAQQAYDRAIRLLGVSARATGELRDRLLKLRFDPAIVDGVIARLTEQSLLDDRRFALERAAALGGLRGYGPKKLKWDLVRRGIDPKIIQEALAQAYGEASPEERMRALALKRFGQGALRADQDPKRRAKVQRFLIGRGFDPHQVFALFSGHEDWGGD
jgi:regulatory protein